MKSKYDIIWMESVDSTNDEAKRRLSDIDNLSVLSAQCQTAGRGQRGNSWSSSSGENLLFSVVLKFDSADALPPVQAHDQFIISEAAALSAVDLLASHGIEAKIKWPNDIYVGDRKICGILIENSLQGQWLSHSIVGIGLNVNQRYFDVNLPNPTSMVLCRDDVDYNTHELLEEFMEIFVMYLERYCHIKGGYAKMRRMYLAQLWRTGQESSFIKTNGARKFTGTIQGLDDIGQLIIRLPDGSSEAFGFKEISYII